MPPGVTTPLILDITEAAFEFGVGAAQRVFRVELQVAGEIDAGKQHVSHFICQSFGLSAAIDFVLQFAQFLFEFRQDGRNFGPVEAAACGPFLKFFRTGQRGVPNRDIVEQARLFTARAGLLQSDSARMIMSLASPCQMQLKCPICKSTGSPEYTLLAMSKNTP